VSAGGRAEPEAAIQRHDGPDGAPDWAAFRRLFPIFDHGRYFAACSQGPLCTPVEAGLARFMDSWRRFGNPWETDWMPTVGRTTERFGRLIGAPAGSIGITASVSAALGTVLSALDRDFRQRPKVIASALDFPTLPDVLLAYAQQGSLELELLPASGGEVPFEHYERAIDARTSLVCLSSASYATGARLPLRAVAEVAHARGALCLVDAYQTVGALGLDVGQVQPDVLVTGALKYLLGTSGVGLLYVAPELAARLEPRDIGWMAVDNPFGLPAERLEYAAGGARFQGGTFCIPGCYAAEAALDLLLALGPAAIEARVLHLVRRFVDGLLGHGIRPLGPTGQDALGPMVAVPVTGDAYGWQERLRHEQAIITSARGQALRFSFHAYNDETDVDACLEALERTGLSASAGRCS
jgi:selenocysteine lyase/cysteine desulfurase